MEKDNSCLYVCIIVAFAFAFSVFGFMTGMLVSHNIIWNSLEKAGISRLVEHETIVDGVVTTNWVEIVWKDGKNEKSR